MKTKLVLRSGDFTSFHISYLQFYWTRYFDISYFELGKAYESNSLFVVGHDQIDSEFCKQLTDQNHRVVVDYLWNPRQARTCKDYYLLKNANWHWYNQSIWYRKLGYHRYQPDKNYRKLAFMQIEESEFNKHPISSIGKEKLDEFIWNTQTDRTGIEGQTFFNPQWYNDTYFSLTVDVYSNGKFINCSEKIFKPIAFYHPFLVIGGFQTLDYLRFLGFETYENIFDESYDTEVSYLRRLYNVIENINNFTAREYDAITLTKLQHNRAHFFDQQLVQSRMLSEIVEPLLHYAES